jgi:ATP-dependent DNA helicase RecG
METSIPDRPDAKPVGSEPKLTAPLQFIKGVGPQRAELFAKLGLLAASDVLFYFPRDYQDLTELKHVPEFEEGMLANVHGTVEEFELRPTSKGGSMLGVLVREQAGALRALWFNQSFMRDKFQVGQQVLLSGKLRQRGLVWEMVHPRVQWLAPGQEAVAAGILPVYSLSEGVNQRQVRSLVETVLEGFADRLEEVFPPAYLEEHGLLPIAEAVRRIHFPDTRESLERARRRFVYQELLVLQAALALKRRQRLAQPAPRLEATARIDARIRRLFPFELTPGQQQAIAEVAADLGRQTPMNRLLQGDVGSGKTIVAVYALLLAVAHRQQAVIMAPTEILARQHYDTLGRLLVAGQVRIGLLVGGLSSQQRQEMLAAIAAGEIDVVIGTQAVVQADVEFARLGLVVIDEQHKFGVRERAWLKRAALAPHYLVMTATPIPRTVSLTLFGDLDVSTLRDAPAGRQNIHTYLADEGQRARWWDFFRKKLREGRQGYVIAPLVDESEQLAAANVQETYEGLANGELEAFRLGLLHGRMSASEKDAVMQSFRQGQTQVLVSTTVIEVGVDVPNATLMTIEGGQRFGLSQLHQLRGRIRRGTHPGYCCVFADNLTEQARERLAAFTKTDDGFELAEMDFKLRGPGELFGTRQHGLPPLLVADLARDGQVLEEARRDAIKLLEQAENAASVLESPPWARLLAMVQKRYGQVLELGDVG